MLFPTGSRPDYAARSGCHPAYVRRDQVLMWGTRIIVLVEQIRLAGASDLIPINHRDLF
ncbi:hypothetical protein [Mucilaginibacter sp.]|jgi:hypothetical protein|uniref:hypothetical protein n=1 Tax=Mucilaginibacter sp. TaxID=1882438 RepID=UPI0035680755